MSDQIEQIGELRYRLNSEYPYPFEVEQAPHFWMAEESGLLAEAIEMYFSGERLQANQLELIKQYLRQYAGRAKLTGDAKRDRLLQAIDKLRTRSDIQRFADDIANYGLEPF